MDRDSDRLAWKGEGELLDDLTARFVPILARLADMRWLHVAAQDVAVSLRDVARADSEELWPKALSLVNCWRRALEERFRGSGLACGELDDRMLPMDMRRTEVAAQFSATGLTVPGTALTDVDLVDAALFAYRMNHCPDRELPPEMVRLLKQNYLTVDCVL